MKAFALEVHNLGQPPDLHPSSLGKCGRVVGSDEQLGRSESPLSGSSHTTGISLPTQASSLWHYLNGGVKEDDNLVVGARLEHGS